MKTLQIKTEKVVKRGIRFRRILSIEGDRLCDLPFKYERGFPHCGVVTYNGNNILSVIGSETNESYLIGVGEDVPEWLFQKIPPIIRESGDRLHKINEKIKQIKLEWNGKEDFEI